MSVLVIPAYAIADTKYSIPDFSSWDVVSTMCRDPAVIISMSISRMRETQAAVKQHPDAKLFCYNWDCYEWAIKNPRPGEYDYTAYGELLKKATEVWVPSYCTGVRTEQWWGINNWDVIRSAVNYWEYGDVQDKGYALCCLRQIPDRWWGKFEETCKKLNIPYKVTRHELSYVEYQKTVAHCRFLCSPLYELSTGGLTLLEGYYLGKPCLLSNSMWHGGMDYFVGRASYFDALDITAFENALYKMYHDTPKVAADHKEYVATNFSDERMVAEMQERVSAYL